MLRALEERRRAGERFYLALVDPLLKKPVHFELKSPTVKVGFLPDCDWTLPWSQMGINVIQESRKLDPTYAFNCCHLVEENSSKELCAPRIGEREKEPFFQMVYDPSKGWRAKCEGMHICRVVDRGTMEKPTYAIREINGVPAEDLSSSIACLEDGTTFAFMWPYESVAERLSPYNLPAQMLWFVFIACQEGQSPSLGSSDGPRNLLSLPDEVLARIGSYLEPEEYFLTLALIGRVFTSWRLKGQIPWTSIKLGASFDSLRVVELVSTETLLQVKCSDIWDPAGKGALYAKWKPVLQHESLMTLELQDPSLLHHVGVPPNLKELRLQMITRQDDFWPALKKVRFPSSITRLVVSYGFEVLPKFWYDAQEILQSEYDIDSVHRLSPKWLFSAFPGLTDVYFHNVFFLKDEWEEVPAESLSKISHLYVDPIVASSFPSLGKMPNLKALQMSLREIPIDDLLGYGSNLSFGELEYLIVETFLTKMMDFDVDIFSFRAPNLRFLQLVASNQAEIYCSDLEQIAKRLPRLEYLYIQNADVALLSIRALLTAIPGLKDVEISGSTRCLGKVVSLESFPQQPGDVLRFTQFAGKEGAPATFNFVFSRATKLERGNAWKFLHRNIGLASNQDGSPLRRD